MNSLWPTVKLGDIAEITSSKRIKMADYVSAGVPFFRSKEIIELSKGNRISTELFISDKQYFDIRSKFGSPEENDILLTSVGTLGIPYQVSVDDKFYFKDGNLTWFRNYSKNIDPKFLYCWLKSTVAKRKFAEITIGSTQQALTIISLKSIKINLPPISEQKAIASVLGALDDKIENNRRMNETLEEMARAIFKSWFVDFDPVHAKAEGKQPVHMDAETAALFPSSFGEDGLPLGWEMTKIEEVAEQIAMGPFGSNIKVSTFVDAGIPIISGKHLNEILLEDKDYNFITEEHANKLLRSNVYREDIVFTHAGNVGQVSIIPETSKYERYVLSQRGFYLRCDKSKISPKYLVHFFKSHLGQHLLLANVSSTGVPSIARPSSYLKSINICLPSMPVLNAFDELAISLHLKVSANKNENIVLAELRDTLLPKLMSGEIRVKDAEKEVSEAI